MEIVRTYNCLVVDDEPPAREVLRRYISQLPMLNLISECGNALQAITALKQQHIDLVFLDIQMPQITGLDLIGTLTNPPKIVLTTAFEQYAVKAFELDVTDYLVKPIRFDRFLKAVNKALHGQDAEQTNPTSAYNATQNNDPAFLYFRAERKMVKVLLNDILYVESLKDYVKINTTKGPIITKYAIASLEAMLPSSFLRVHRSFIVSSQKINSFTSDEIQINAVFIPIGKLYRQQVMEKLTSSNNPR